MKKGHQALYGQVKIPRPYCPHCFRYALALDGKHGCCGKPMEEEPLKVKRMSLAVQRRKRPPLFIQKQILERQEHRCLYCNQLLEEYVRFRGGWLKLLVRWDHETPYKYAQDNRHCNFAAACQRCNSWKSDLMFQTVEEAQIYLTNKWEENR